MIVKSWDIHHLDTVQSTNLIIKEEIAKGTHVGFVAVAKEQISGKGMRGHSWSSPRGGLYFSILLKTSLTPSELPEIPKRTASAVMQALQPLSSEILTIKPPNDIVLKRSYAGDSLRTDVEHECQTQGVRHSFTEKLVGISSEIFMEKLCIGIGINVFPPNEPIKLEGVNVPVYLSDLTKCDLSLDFVLKTVLNALNVKLDL